MAAHERKSHGISPTIRARRERHRSVEADSESFDDQDRVAEGGKQLRLAVVAERDPMLRAKAIALRGLKCMVCAFDFEEFYGERGRQFIEVHHNKPLGERQKAELTDYRTDLDVVCSNCHRMIHRNRSQLLTVEELREIINIRRRKK